jgi:hypothetical protein
MAKEKKKAAITGSQWEKDNGYSNVAIPNELYNKIIEYKEKTGCSIKFFIMQALKEKFERVEFIGD